MSRELTWLRRIRDHSQRLSVSEELPRLPSVILDAAIELADAERGFLVLVDGQQADGSPKTRVAQARGFDRAALQSSQVKVSRTVIKRVLDRDRSLVSSSDREDADVMQVSSVESNRVRSIACVPLRLREAVLGVLYLDHRFVEDAFTEEDLPLLEVFASQAALALEWARTRAQEAERTLALQSELRELRERAPEAEGEPEPLPPSGTLERYGALAGGSPPMLALYEEIERAARCDDPVLLLGEPGSGLELVARELHARGHAPEEPFVVETCALTGQELRAALFGTADRVGAFERAGRGTLLLDDVDQLTPDLQVRVVQVLKHKAWPGLVGPVPLRCRVVAASHEDLRGLTREGVLREDLYYRFDVMRLVVPPLRQRGGDLPRLIEALTPGDEALELTPEALRLLRGYGWPGNVRELANEVGRWVAAGRGRVTKRDLSPELRAGRGSVSAGATLQQVEARAVQEALERCQGNKSRTAKELGVPRSTLYHLLDKHGLR
jgi:DNA-binding NtrC family response regulator